MINIKLNHLAIVAFLSFLYCNVALYIAIFSMSLSVICALWKEVITCNTYMSGT